MKGTANLVEVDQVRGIDRERGSMTPAEALARIALGEGQTNEFKTSFAEERQAIESLGAFANSEGGMVFIGVSPDGAIKGITLAVNRLENFGNAVQRHTDPRLHPTIQEIQVSDDQIVVVVSIGRARPGELFYAYDRALIRVGKTNQRMSAQEQKARLLGFPTNRPRFEVVLNGCNRREESFQPDFGVSQVQGDVMANIEWRIRGPRFDMDWRSAPSSQLNRTKFTAAFNLSQISGEEDLVPLNEMGFEIAFYWLDQWRSEIHRWPLTRRDLGHKVLWDIGSEVLPPKEIDYQYAPWEEPPTKVSDWQFD